MTCKGLIIANTLLKKNCEVKGFTLIDDTKYYKYMLNQNSIVLPQEYSNISTNHVYIKLIYDRRVTTEHQGKKGAFNK